MTLPPFAVILGLATDLGDSTMPKRPNWDGLSTEEKVEALYEELHSTIEHFDGAIGRLIGRIVKLEKASKNTEGSSR